MVNKKVKVNNTPISLRRAHVDPAYGEKAIITTDIWEYVEMWLRRNNHSTARWLQARAFYDVVPALPIAARPLLVYYFALNAVSTLLDVNKIECGEFHGVRGSNIAESESTLEAENVLITGKGAMNGLRRYFSNGPDPVDITTTLKDLFSGLSYLHRPYTLTYTSEEEQLIPVTRPYFAKIKGNSEGYIECVVENTRWEELSELSEIIPLGFESYKENENTILRRKTRFELPAGEKEKLIAIGKEHAKVRVHFVCITRAAKQHWYLKARGLQHQDLPQMVIMYAALHRMSALARYDPKRMTCHLDSSHNWLVSEFLRGTPEQFLRQVVTEITKHNVHVNA